MSSDISLSCKRGARAMVASYPEHSQDSVNQRAAIATAFRPTARKQDAYATFRDGPDFNTR